MLQLVSVCCSCCRCLLPLLLLFSSLARHYFSRSLNTTTTNLAPPDRCFLEKFTRSALLFFKPLFHLPHHLGRSALAWFRRPRNEKKVYSAFRLVKRVADAGKKIAVINLGGTRAERSGLELLKASQQVVRRA